MARSLKVAHQYIQQVKGALRLNGYARQIDLAEELNLSLSTVNNFFNGRPIDALNFYEICQSLGLDSQQIANWQQETQDRVIYEINEVNIEPQVKSNYIPRPPIEELCYETIKQPGSLLRIKASEGMGKTSLIEQILHQAKHQHYQTINLSLLLADKSVLKGIEEFLRWFCSVITRQLGLTNKLRDYWEQDLGSSYNCTVYFEEYLLPQLNSPLVLLLDDVDYLFEYPSIAEDFLKLLRAWYEQAKTDLLWQKLRLVLGYSTEEYISFDINHSPFNVGILIELPDFTPKQIQDLAKTQGLNWDSSQVQQIMNMVGGHPYLLQIAINELKHQKITLENLLQNAPTEAGIYNEHLRELLEILENKPELAIEMKKIIEANEAVFLTPILAFKLHSLGLVELDGNKVKPRYKLYRLYFRTHLLKEVGV